MHGLKGHRKRDDDEKHGIPITGVGFLHIKVLWEIIKKKMCKLENDLDTYARDTDLGQFN